MSTTNETMTWDGFREQAAARAGLLRVVERDSKRVVYAATEAAK